MDLQSKTAELPAAPRNLRLLQCLLFLALAGNAPGFSPQDVRTVFLIVMENQPWSAIQGNPDCPYINRALLPQAARCERYSSPAHLHPTLPNYLWLVAGTNFGIYDDGSAYARVQDTTNHLAFFLDAAGISWKHYLAGLAHLSYPPTDVVYPYHPAFNPFLYFRNVLTNADYCRSHMRPAEELDSDLTRQSVARFNLISPGLWDSMHDSGPAGGDRWLATVVPKILASAAYQDSGALFITWDEDDFAAQQRPVGMILLSPLGKGGGYWNGVPYTHSSTLRTLQNIFGVFPYLGDAANATDLGDLFRPLLLTALPRLPDGACRFRAEQVVPNRSYLVEACTNLAAMAWETVRTNVATTTNFIFLDDERPNQPQRFYRLREAP